MSDTVNQHVDNALWRGVPPVAEYVNNLHFTVAGVKSVTVPSGAGLVLFGTTALPFYVSTTGTAAVPTGDVTNGTGVAVSPTMRQVFAGDVLSIYSAQAAEMSIEFFKATA